MASPLDPLIKELQAHLLKLEPKIEGFSDYALLDLEETTQAFVSTAHTAYVNRQTATRAAIAALETIARGTYPELPEFTVSPEIYQDLNRNQGTIASALEVVEAEPEATKGKIVLTKVEPEPAQ
jgi:hypothetical protein